MRKTFGAIAQYLCISAFLSCVATHADARSTLPTPLRSAHERVPLQLLEPLPLAFEENRGQSDASVKFFARAKGYQLFLTRQEAVLVLGSGAAIPEAGSAPSAEANSEPRPYAVRMRFEGSNESPSIRGVEPLEFKTNYFIGDEDRKAVTNIPNHAKVEYRSLYPGVDLLYYGNEQRLEYDFVVAPRARPEQIRISFAGADDVRLSHKGDLILTTPLGNLTFHKPIAYQQLEGSRRAVSVNYVIAKSGKVGFRLGKYNVHEPLIIDPIVSYSSFVWGEAKGIAIDPAGNVYIVGTYNGNGTSLPATGGYQSTLQGYSDAFVVKLDPTGSKVLYATYLGARRSSTEGRGIAVDGTGNAYIFGIPSSASFPVTSGAYQTTYAAGASFVTKLNAAGNALVYSTFVSGSSIESIAVDNTGSAYITGNANALITTEGAFQPTPLDGSSPFVAKLNATGTAMSYATYLGGNGFDEAHSIAVDASGNAYIAGSTDAPNFPTANPLQSALLGPEDAFVTKLNPTGTALVYSTYLGGTQRDYANAIAVNAAGEAFVVGGTRSDDFPVSQNAFQRRKGYPGYTVSNAFVSKFSASGAELIYSSYLGGDWYFCSGCGSANASSDQDVGMAVAVDAAGYAYLAGYAKSIKFPAVDPVQSMTTTGGDLASAPFFAKVAPDGERLIYSTLFGPRLNSSGALGIAADANGNVSAIGIYDRYSISEPSQFPITASALLTAERSFLVKLKSGKRTVSLRTNTPYQGSPTQPITFTADISSTTTGGTVTFMNGTSTLGVVPVTNGTASITTTLPAGVHKIIAIFSGDGSSSMPVFQIVNSVVAW